MEEALVKKSTAKNDTRIDGKDVNLGSSVTPFLLFSTLVAGFACVTFGCATGYSSAAEAGIVADMGLSTAQYSLFGSIMTFGSMFSATACGKLADLLGRKRAMLLMDIFFILGWSAIIFAETVFWLHFGRFLLGIGTGIFTHLSPVYVAEIAPKNLRGGFASSLQMMTGFGVSLTFFIGNVIAWRTLAVIGALPCLPLLFGLFFIPESPRWLAKYGQEKQLEDTLRHIRGENVDVTDEATEIRDSIETLHQLSRSRYLEMFERKYAHSLIVVIGTLVLVPLAGSMAIVFYASSVFKVAGSSISFGTTVIAVIQIPVCALAILLLDRSGRRSLLIVSLTGSCLGSFLAGLAFILQINYSAFGMGAAIPWVIMAEILPLNIRGSAGSLATFTNLFISWIINYVFNFLLEWSPSGTFFILASFSGLAILFVAMVVPETKGKTLEEIEASILI
ncbi:hypothetical protein ACET3Z_021862 [Daucus carota]